MKEKFEPFSLEKSVFDMPRVDMVDVKKVKNPIIFDTNFLFVPFEFKLDIIAQLRTMFTGNYNLFIYEGTIDELKAVERKGDKNKKFLPLIVKMLKIYDFKIINSEKSYIDEQILDGLNNKILVATNDKELRRKVWDRGYKVLYMRQKSYLEIN